MTMRLPGSVLSPDQRDRVDWLAATLDRDQAIWLSGYFAGLAGGAAVAVPPNGAGPALPAEAPPAAAPATRVVTVLYGSETGNSKELAQALVDAAGARRIEARLADMADYRPRALKDEQDLIVVTS